MKTNLSKRFFREEEGLEALQIVLIGVICAIFGSSCYLVGSRLFADSGTSISCAESSWSAGSAGIAAESAPSVK